MFRKWVCGGCLNKSIVPGVSTKHQALQGANEWSGHFALAYNPDSWKHRMYLVSSDRSVGWHVINRLRTRLSRRRKMNCSSSSRPHVFSLQFRRLIQGHYALELPTSGGLKNRRWMGVNFPSQPKMTSEMPVVLSTKRCIRWTPKEDKCLLNLRKS